MRRRCAFGFVVISLALFLSVSAIPNSAVAESYITGTTKVPGQDGTVQYDISAKKLPGKNKFKITVKLRRKPGTDFPQKKFYICMMLQLTDNGQQE